MDIFEKDIGWGEEKGTNKFKVLSDDSDSDTPPDDLSQSKNTQDKENIGEHGLATTSKADNEVAFNEKAANETDSDSSMDLRIHTQDFTPLPKKENKPLIGKSSEAHEIAKEVDNNEKAASVDMSEVPKTPTTLKRKRKHGDDLPSTSKKNKIKKMKRTPTKEETENDKSSDEEEEASKTEADRPSAHKRTKEEATTFRLQKLRKCAHHAGIGPQYGKLLKGIESDKQKARVLEQFLVDKGISKPITLEKCKEYKAQREKETELEELKNNEILEAAEEGKRVTRSARKIVTRNSRVQIDDSSDESNADKGISFSGLEGIVSAGESD